MSRARWLPVALVVALVGCRHEPDAHSGATPPGPAAGGQPRKEADAEARLDAALAAWVAASGRASDAPTEANIAESKALGAKYREALRVAADPYRGQLDELARFFDDDADHIYLSAFSSRDMLRDKGIAVTIPELLDGASKVAGALPTGGGEKFRAFGSLYETWREDGLDHDATIAKMIELEKF